MNLLNQNIMKSFFKIFAAVFTILFLYAVVVQYNDPDAVKWYFIYGVAVLVSILFLFDKLPFMVVALLCIGYLIGSFIAWPEQFEGVTIGAGDIVNIEEGREALGLLIVSAVMLTYALRIKFLRRL